MERGQGLLPRRHQEDAVSRAPSTDPAPIANTTSGDIPSIQAVYVQADDFAGPAAVHTFSHPAIDPLAPDPAQAEAEIRSRLSA